MSGKKRISYSQRVIMLEYIRGHPFLSTGRFEGPDGARTKTRHWEILARKLNAVGSGASKKADKWLRSWQDWKSDVRSKAAKLSKDQRGTGGGPPPKPLTDLEEQVVSLIGREVIDGISNVRDPLSDYTHTPELTSTTTSHSYTSSYTPAWQPTTHTVTDTLTTNFTHTTPLDLITEPLSPTHTYSSPLHNTPSPLHSEPPSPRRQAQSPIDICPRPRPKKRETVDEKYAVTMQQQADSLKEIATQLKRMADVQAGVAISQQAMAEAQKDLAKAVENQGSAFFVMAKVYAMANNVVLEDL